MSLAIRVLLVLAVVACRQGQVLGDVLTFEGLQNHEEVANFYNGGFGSLGSGPGPSDGITFSTDALALVRVTPFPGDPSPPTVLLLGDLSNPFGAGFPLTMTMDVAGGFTQSLNFYDIAIGRVATVQIWSGADGTGTLLTQETLPLLPPSNEVFTGPVSMSFSGIANSVVFTGGNLQLAFDDISFGSQATVPEPLQGLEAVIVLWWLYLLRPRRNKGSSAASGPGS